MIGEIGGDTDGLMGREKLTDPLFPPRSCSIMFLRLGFLGPGGFFDWTEGTPGPRSRLTPLPPDNLGGGEVMRSGGSALAGLLTSLEAPDAAYAFGRAGIGGGCSSLNLDIGREGDCSRNVLSVIDPELPCLLRRPGAAALPFEEFDA